MDPLCPLRSHIPHHNQSRHSHTKAPEPSCEAGYTHHGSTCHACVHRDHWDTSMECHLELPSAPHGGQIAAHIGMDWDLTHRGTQLCCTRHCTQHKAGRCPICLRSHVTHPQNTCTPCSCTRLMNRAQDTWYHFEFVRMAVQGT